AGVWRIHDRTPDHCKVSSCASRLARGHHSFLVANVRPFWADGRNHDRHVVEYLAFTPKIFKFLRRAHESPEPALFDVLGKAEHGVVRYLTEPRHTLLFVEVG